MPISNPDDKKEKERFPKDISRRLFPGFPDMKIRGDLEDAVSKHANVDLPNRSKRDESPSHKRSIIESVQSLPGQRPNVGVEPPPSNNNIERERKPYVNSQLNSAVEDTNPYPAQPPVNHRASVGPENAFLPPNNIERERKPYSSVPPESAIDDTNPFPPPPSSNIERERNPYSQPGAGRGITDDLRVNETGIGIGKPRADSVASNLGRPEPIASKIRSDSNARARPIPLGSSMPGRGPMEIPKPEIHQHRQPSNVRRHRSPSFSRVRDDFRRSDGDLRGYQPTFQPGVVPADGFDDEGRRIARERARRQAEDEARNYGESPSSRARYERPVIDINGPPRGPPLNEEDYYRNNGRGAPPGNGYDYQQPYGGPAYR